MSDGFSGQVAPEKSPWWRAVLGEYPTGVCLVTSRGDGGEPLGMIVGSFVAVSEDPPLIGFLAGERSGTLPGILRNGRFGVSVLDAGSEHVCRAFAEKDPDRWHSAAFRATSMDVLRLRDAVIWFDASIESVESHGDHVFVVGRVDDFGSEGGASAMPLLFRRAGYGAFAAPTQAYDARAFIERLRWATAAERDVESLADDVDAEVTVTAQLGDSVVTLASISSRLSSSSYENVGASHPWAAPIAPIFAAWAPPSRQRAWEEASRHLTGAVDRDLIGALLQGIRDRGYAVAGDSVLTDRFLELSRATDTGRDSYARMWGEIAEEKRLIEAGGDVEWSRVAVVQFPVFDGQRDPVLALDVIVRPPHPDQLSFENVIRRARLTTERMHERIVEKQASSVIASSTGAAAAAIWGDGWG